MFEQYNELKKANPDAILFFRMGDFYEVFFEDAVIASKELDLTLTARNKHAPNPIPMAGVPHHASAGYIEKLVANGYRVAIAEQVQGTWLVKSAKGWSPRSISHFVSSASLSVAPIAHARNSSGRVDFLGVKRSSRDWACPLVWVPNDLTCSLALLPREAAWALAWLPKAFTRSAAWPVMAWAWLDV